MPSRRVSDPVDPESFFAFHLTWQPSRESPSAIDGMLCHGPHMRHVHDGHSSFCLKHP